MSPDRVRGHYVRAIASHTRAVREFAVLLAVCCCLSAVSARGLETTPQPVASSRPDFNSEEIRRQVRAHRSTTRLPAPSTPAFDDGEFLIDTSTTRVTAPRDQGEAAIAFDGTNFLLVWVDDRGSGDLFGARVTPAGVVLDPTGFAISTRSTGPPALAFDGENFLVVWEESPSSSTRGARVTPAGVVLDPTGFAISTRSSEGPPALAFDGENSLVVWEDWRSLDGDIYGARVTPAGAVLDPAGIAIADAADREFRPTVAFDGGNFLVVWNDCRSSYDIYGARVTPAGVVLDSAGIPISTAASDQFFPVVACDGENFLVVWQDNRGGGYYDIYGARVTRAGVVLDTTGIVISTEASFQDFPPAVAFDGGNFLVAWQDPRSGSSYDIYGARVTPAGGVLDSAGFAVSTAVGTQWCPALAFDGTNFLVVWTDGRSAWSYDIYGARVTPAGTVLDSKGIAISTAAYGQAEPDVAFDGTNFLAVWEDERTGGAYDIYGARVTTEGVVLDSEGIAISTGADYEGQPVLAFDGENFLVVWQDRRSGLYCDIYGARVTPAGVVLDSTGIAISTAADDQVYPALAFDGGNLLVVWFDCRCGNYDADIYGARVTPAGVVLDPNGIAISTEADYQVYPALAFDGDNFLVAWQDQRGGGGHDNIYGARVTPEGVVLDPDGISVSTAVGEQRNPVPIFDSENFLVVWETNLGPIGIYGARVTPAGVVLDPTGIVISTAADGQLYPALAFDGENSLVVWQDSRGGSDVDLYRARVRPDGTVFDKGLVVSQEGNQSYPALARGSGDQMFLVYQGWAGTVGGKAYNTERIWGKLGPFPGIGEAPRLSLNSPHLNATIVRGVLLLKESTSTSWLLDAAGRKVLDLAPGANDVRGLAPGVYFVREAQAQAIQKVVLAR